MNLLKKIEELEKELKNKELHSLYLLYGEEQYLLEDIEQYLLDAKHDAQL